MNINIDIRGSPYPQRCCVLGVNIAFNRKEDSLCY